MALLKLQPKNITWFKRDANGSKSYRRIDNVIDITPEKAMSILTIETDKGYSNEIIYFSYKVLLDNGYLRQLRDHNYKRPLLARALELRKQGVI